jgi:polyferredoxin
LRGEPPHIRLVRPRTILYSIILVVVGAVMLYALWARFSIGLDVIKDRNPEFVRHADGAVLNGYSVKLLNHADRTRTLFLSVEGADFASVKVVGVKSAAQPIAIPVESDRVRALRVLLTEAKRNLKSSGLQKIEFHLTDPGTHESVEADSVFIGGEH